LLLIFSFSCAILLSEKRFLPCSMKCDFIIQHIILGICPPSADCRPPAALDVRSNGRRERETEGALPTCQVRVLCFTWRQGGFSLFQKQKGIGFVPIPLFLLSRLIVENIVVVVAFPAFLTDLTNDFAVFLRLLFGTSAVNGTGQQKHGYS